MNTQIILPISILIILLFSVIPYLNTLSADLVHDDRFAILENPDISSSLNLKNIFTNDFWGTPIRSQKSHKSYRPVTVLTFKLNHYFHQFAPLGYHLVNVLIHACNSILFLLLCYYYVFPRSASLSVCSASLFAAHPIHTEAVAGTVGRAELLACTTFLIALALFQYLCDSTRESNSKFPHLCTQILILFGVAVVSAVSTLCKESGITVLGVCGLLDIGIFSRLNIITALQHLLKFEYASAWNSCKQFLFRATFLFLFLVAILYTRLAIQGRELPGFIDEDNPASFSSSPTELLTYNYLYFVNVLLLMFPSGLSYDWQMGSIPLVQHLSDARNLGSLLFWMLLITLSIKLAYLWLKPQYGNPRQLMYSLVFIIVPFIPSSNIFLRVGFVVAERVLYIPSIGMCIFVTLGISQIISRFKFPQISLFAIYILVVLYSFKTYQRNKIWFDRESLFLSGIKDMPHNAKMHYNYANFLKDNSRNTEAIFHYRQAVKLWPSHASSHNNLGTLLEGEEAIRHFKAAVTHKPTHSKAFFNLGNRLAVVERYSEAVDAFKHSLQIDNTSSDCWQSLATALTNMHSPQSEILSCLEQAELTSTRSLTHLKNLAKLHQDIGMLSRARHYYSECIREWSVNEGVDTCYLSLAVVYRLEGELIKSEEQFQRTIELFPEFSQAYTSFGSFLFNTQRQEQALHVYRRAFQINPEQHQNMISNFVQILLKFKLYSEARLLINTQTDSSSNNPSVEMVKLSVQIEFADGQDKTVLDMLNQFSSLVEDSNELLHFKAMSLRNLKLYEKSVQIYQKMLLSDPDNPTLLHDTGILYHLMKKYKDSLYYYQRALDLLPNDPLISENLKKLRGALKDE